MYLKVYLPRASDCVESSGPARSGPTRCNTTHAPAIGSRLRAPGRTTRPDTCWGTVGSAVCSCNSSRTAKLHVELPKVFRPQVLQILLQLLGGHFLRRLGQCFRRRLAFLE